MASKAVITIIGKCINFLSFFNLKFAVAIAFDLFTTPRKNRLSFTDLPALLEEAERTAIEDVKSQKSPVYSWDYSTNDKAKKILLIHGWESNSNRWSRLIKKLKQFNCIITAIDAPGHGLSNQEKFTVIDYSNAIKSVTQIIKPDYIVAHSIGVLATAHMLSEQNFEPKKLFLLGGPNQFKEIFQGYTKMMNYNSKVVNGLSNFFKKKYNIDIEYFSTSDLLKKSTCKKIILHDTQDQIVHFQNALDLQKDLLNCELHPISQSNHSLQNNSVLDIMVKHMTLLKND